uniref:Uncharacterized protein n=1 Tax=Sinocyclocheilus anshuiensis TaxID=1608454 RepID=A0A671MDA0_9TELE
MPSDFTSLFSADIDLDSPKSLYSKDSIKLNALQADSVAFATLLESVYDLLPKELQLPSSREQSAAAMSQKSGGEAGPPPSTAVAAGKLCFHLLNHLFSQMLKTGAKACIVMHIHLPTFSVVN